MITLETLDSELKDVNDFITILYWCQRNGMDVHYEFGDTLGSTLWTFENEKDASMFALRWL